MQLIDRLRAWKSRRLEVLLKVKLVQRSFEWAVARMSEKECQGEDASAEIGRCVALRGGNGASTKLVYRYQEQ
jgi:hypothetical protein